MWKALAGEEQPVSLCGFPEESLEMSPWNFRDYKPQSENHWMHDLTSTGISESNKEIKLLKTQ
jgi:hypothetical protein